MATLYENLMGGTITDNPLTSGATTINSSAFQYLPTVTGPDVMYLTLDPEGTGGDPEIVKVTAHTAAATSVTVVRAQQDTAARSHVLSTPWVHALTDVDVDEFLKTVAVADFEADVLARLPQAGDLKWTLDTSETAAWKNHNQTLVGADVAYPSLWAVAPAGWKSGSDLVIPDLSDVAMIGAGSVAALGSTGGSNTRSLIEANVPGHTHTGPSHTHTMTHGHGDNIAVSTGGSHNHAGSLSGVTADQSGHVHSAPNYGAGSEEFISRLSAFSGHEAYVPHDTSKTATAPAGYTNMAVAYSSGMQSTDPAITVTSSSVTLTSTTTHSHTVTGAVTDFTGSTVADGTGNTGTGSGSGTSFSIVHASLGVNVQVLAY